MPTNRANFLDLSFDRLTSQDVQGRLRRVTPASRYGYIVTPNVDHLVRLHREPALLELYGSAALCLCDSKVLRFLARLRGIRLPLVPGSDLAAALFADVIQAGDRIAIIGGSSAFLEQLRARFPAIDFVQHVPPMGLRQDARARRVAATFLATSRVRFAFLMVGSPQQEMIAREAGQIPESRGVSLCIGAGLEFLTGEQKRAPRWIRALGFEWAHRLATNPRRLWRRYLVDGMRIFPIYLRWRRGAFWPMWTGAVLAVGGLTAASIYGARFYTQRSPNPRGDQAAFLHPDQLAALNLPPPNLLRPLSAEEATEKNQERPFVNRPDTSAGRFVLRSDTEGRERALTCLTQAVYYEAAGEGADGERAVAQVVLNRMRHPGYPASVCGVVYQGSERTTGCQFTFTCDGSLLRVPVDALWARSRKIAEEALAGRVFAPIGHATHYHADYVLPYWADSLDKTVQIGRHIFYRLRSSLGDSRSFFQRYAGSEPQIRPPEAAVVVPPERVTDELATALLSDGIAGPATDVEKASPQPSSSPLADSAGSTLFADGDAATSSKARTPNTSSDCPLGDQRKQLTPLRANDMRAAASSPTC